MQSELKKKYRRLRLIVGFVGVLICGCAALKLRTIATDHLAPINKYVVRSRSGCMRGSIFDLKTHYRMIYLRGLDVQGVDKVLHTRLLQNGYVQDLSENLKVGYQSVATSESNIPPQVLVTDGSYYDVEGVFIFDSRPANAFDLLASRLTTFRRDPLMSYDEVQAARRLLVP